jgi:hypothetical protein
MEFIHAMMVAGSATLAIPVVIHLIFRIKRKRLVFSSLKFLQQTVLKQSQRLRLRELLLLLLRCAACVLIALAFARPFRPDSVLSSSGGKPQEDVIFLIDDSPSLAAQEAGSMRWNTLLTKAQKTLESYPEGNRVGLVLVSDPTRAEIEIASNFGGIKASLQKARPSDKRGDLAQGITTALELLANAPQPNKRLVIYSDLQNNAIDRSSGGTGALGLGFSWAELAQKAATGNISIEIETPTSGSSTRLTNVGISDVRAKSDVWIEGQPIPFAVRVANPSDTEVSALNVKLKSDGKVLATRIIGIGPRTSTEIELAALFPRAGEVSGTVEIEAHDAFPEDDQRYFAVHLRNNLNVLVLEDRLGERDSFLDEGYYVRMALEPKARGLDLGNSGGTPSNFSIRTQGTSDSYVRVRSLAIANLTADKIRDVDVLVAVGIISMKENELSILEDAVARGKKLILFAGNSRTRLSETFYNDTLWKKGLGLLPARLGSYYEGNTLDGKYHQLGEFKADHTLFKTFKGENESNLRLPRYIRHYQIQATDLKSETLSDSSEVAKTAANQTAKNLSVHPNGDVLARFSDGSPFAVERPFGMGSVLMFPFSPRPEATDLPKRKVFVPLIHQAIRHFAGVTSVSRRSLIVGEAFDFADAGATLETGVSLEFIGATKEIQSLLDKDHPVFEWAGLYKTSFKNGELQERADWAANIDARESDLSCEDVTTIRAIFASNSKETSVLSDGQRVEWDDERKSQAPDWRYFLVAAMLCLLLELVIRDFL